MSIHGVVAELNPLHNGHAYLFEQMRQGEDDVVVCVMSGNFVQRGEPAFVSKWARAEMALACGADLVVELPVGCCLSSAKPFALGGVAILDKLHVDTLFFGSECADKQKLLQAVKAIAENDEKIVQLLGQGMSYAQARQAATGCEILSHPNDILGVEYLSAIERLGSHMQFEPIGRKGAGHHEDADGRFASSTYLRTLPDGMDKWLPKAAYQLLQEQIDAGHTPDVDKTGHAVLLSLRKMKQEDFASLPDISEGLGKRLFNAVQQAATVEEIIQNTKTRRYPESRIRRIVMSALLGLTAKQSPPPYLHVLALNDKGASVLKHADLPIVIRAADADLLSQDAKRVYQTECLADDIYTSLLRNPMPCGTTKTQPVIKKEKTI